MFKEYSNYKQLNQWNLNKDVALTGLRYLQGKD